MRCEGKKKTGHIYIERETQREGKIKREREVERRRK